MAPSPVESDAMWSAIETSVSKTPPTARIYPFVSWSRWAGVAAVLLIGVIGVWYLVGESGTAYPEFRATTDIAEVRLDDGSTMLLRPNTTVRLTSLSDDRHLYRLDGEATFIVAAGERQFVVQTERGEVTVLGTRFNVKSWGDRMEVYVLEGRVSVASADDEHVATLQGGEVAFLENSRLDVIRDDRSDLYTAWHERRLILDGRPLSTLVVELSHHFDLDLTLDPDLRDETLTGSIELLSADETLQELAAALGARLVGDPRSGYHLAPG